MTDLIFSLASAFVMLAMFALLLSWPR